MKIVIIDGMGGGIGRNIAEKLRDHQLRDEIILVGTNASATSNMMKSGFSPAATGENAILYNVGMADIVIGPMGIVLPNAMYGEISPAMAQAVAASSARKILIPVQMESIHIMGLSAGTLAEHVEQAARLCAEWCRTAD